MADASGDAARASVADASGDAAKASEAHASRLDAGAAQAGSNGGHAGHRGTRAIQRMVEFAPSTGGLALWVRHQDVGDPPGTGQADPDATPVATDGHTLYYQASFEALPIAEQVGRIAHEVLHIALRHPQRFLDLQAQQGDADLQLFTICADAIVNSTLGHLSWLELPPGSLGLDRLLASTVNIQQDVEKSLLEWDVERLYRAIDDRRAAGSRPTARRGDRQPREGDDDQAGSTPSQQAGRGTPQPAETAPSPRQDGPKAATTRALGAASDPDLLPRAGAQGAPEAEADEAREWAERLVRAHTGDGAFSMLRTLIADLPRSQTPWEQVLRTQLARGLSPQRELSWSRPARSYLANQGRMGPQRRLPWEPGYSATKAVPRLALIVDVSGSIEDRLMDRFACEIEAILRRQEAALVLVIGDDQVRRVERIEAAQVGSGRGAAGGFDLRAIAFHGGGGTDFTPLLEEADRHRPDIAVVLTDLDGPARFRPRWPVIWAVPGAYASAVAPFGRKLTLR